jgi:ribosomal protein S18 acetylase RimI-like enzyme
MSVTIRNMTQPEFENFYQRSVQYQVVQLMDARGISREEAGREAEEELAGMLPNGLHTENNFLMSIISNEEIVGYIWTLHEERQGRKQSFLCDFAIQEDKRRQGYGTEALRLMEKQAADAGCVESVLFVADQNLAARALYEKCGYKLLRQAGSGKYMIKELKTDL